EETTTDPELIDPELIDPELIEPELIDPELTEAFGDRLVGMISDAATVLMASIGHQTGLFATLEGRASSTSAEIARAAGLHERYVREWLNAMTTARIVIHEPGDRTYRLPPEHAAWLTDAAGPDNLARVMQYIPLMAEVEQPIVECFRQGGGLTYAHYPRFHALMAAESGAVFDAALIDSVVPLVEDLDARLREGIDVADVGCGSGHAVNLLAAAYPNSRVTGFDFSEEAVAAGRAEAAALGLHNAHFEVRDAAELGETGAFDLVTAFDSIHDQAHPAAVLEQVAGALRPDGVFLMCDIKASSNVEENLEHPFGPFLYTISAMHCMTVSLGLGGDGLGTAWGEQVAVSMLHEAGFADVEVREVEGDVLNNYYVARR
ncbi:class I SAM-dependent methyltransferase, partial [Nocardioides sp.]|uniref:class I SAM-dependent methyltransferase n=1 Tax=Nocardioides sp. TaxID=35761 RepID=UPI0027337F84